MTEETGFKRPTFQPSLKATTPEMLEQIDQAGRALGFNVASGTGKPPKRANPRRVSLVLEDDVYQRLAARGLRNRMKLQTMIEQFIIERRAADGD